MSAPVAPSGVITLTTDFGLADAFVGVMKGRILGIFREAAVIDLTHGISPWWPAEAGFWLARSFADFPPGTVHVAVVDPGVGTDRGILAVEAGGHLFLAPDNGLLAPVLSPPAGWQAPGPLIVRVDIPALARFGVRQVSRTFHGRDVFAPLAAHLAAGRCRLQDLGVPVPAAVPSPVAAPAVEAGRVSGVVITIDHFGNLISNIDADLLGSLSAVRSTGRPPVVEAGGLTLPLSRTYGEVQPGEYLALINAFGVVEVARAQGSAQAGLGLARGAAVVVRDGPPGA